MKWIECSCAVSCTMHMFATKWHWWLRCRTASKPAGKVTEKKQSTVWTRTKEVVKSLCHSYVQTVNHIVTHVVFHCVKPLSPSDWVCEREGAERLSPSQQLHSSSASGTHLQLREMGHWSREEHFMPRTSAFTAWLAERETPPGESSFLPSLGSSWCFLSSLEWCPSAGAARACSLWSCVSSWWSWWPAAALDRSMTGGRQGRPAMEDLTSTLFWTSECFHFHSTSQESVIFGPWLIWEAESLFWTKTQVQTSFMSSRDNNELQ